MNVSVSEAPKRSRLQIENHHDQTTINIGWSRNVKHMAEGGVWLIFWVLTFLLMILVYPTIGYWLIKEGYALALIFLVPIVLMGLFLWFVNGAIGIKAVLQQMIIKEVLHVSYSGIRLTRQYLVFRVSKEYPIDEIGVFLAVRPEMTPLMISKSGGSGIQLPACGAVSFRYQNKKRVCFGMDLEPEEAETIVRTIQQKYARFSGYRPELVN